MCEQPLALTRYAFTTVLLNSCVKITDMTHFELWLFATSIMCVLEHLLSTMHSFSLQNKKYDK